MHSILPSAKQHCFNCFDTMIANGPKGFSFLPAHPT